MLVGFKCIAHLQLRLKADNKKCTDDETGSCFSLCNDKEY